MARRILLFVFLLLSMVSAALAQNGRSAVSVGGNDANPCTVALPCRSFGVAISQTQPGGEILALDTAGYGPFVVDRAVMVSGAPAIRAGITVASGNGISVAAGAADRVVLRNLALIGSGGLSGVDIASAAETRLVGCEIHGFSNAGINISGTGNLSVDHSLIADNGNDGINIGNNTTTTSHTTINETVIAGHLIGVLAGSYTDVVLLASRLAGNDVGVKTDSSSATDASVTDVTIERCAIENSPTNAVWASATGNNVAHVTLSASVFAYNGIALFSNGGGFALIFSFQNNTFAGNSLDGSLNPIALK